MQRYTVQHSYSAVRDGQRLGPWTADLEVELSDEDAAWINRDSPGALAPVAKKAERAQPPAADRQQRAGRNRGQGS